MFHTVSYPDVSIDNNNYVQILVWIIIIVHGNGRIAAGTNEQSQQSIFCFLSV